MKVLDTSFITDNAAMPVKSGTLDFIQLAYKEMLAELVQDMRPELVTTNYSVLRGLTVNVLGSFENTDGGGGNLEIGSGAVFYNGEIYFVSGGSVSYTTGPSLVLTTTYYTGDGNNADPVLFSDNSSNYVHEIRTLSLAAGDSTTLGASFFCLYSDLVYLPPVAEQVDFTWTALEGKYSSGVANYGNGYHTGEFSSKDQNGNVLIEGVIAMSLEDDTFTPILPAGTLTDVPSAKIIIPVIALNVDTSGYYAASLVIGTDGSANISAVTGGTVNVMITLHGSYYSPPPVTLSL